MVEFVITCILILICIGQVVSLFYGRLQAVTYYICISWLGYFSVWLFGTWDAARLCGVILIIGCWWRNDEHGIEIQRLHVHRFLQIFFYGVVVTVIGQFFWPVEAMGSVSSAYMELRFVVQIISWGIALGAAWWIGLTYAAPAAFFKARPYILTIGLALCLYGFYQYIAYQQGLPATGIRRQIHSAVDQLVGLDGEDFATHGLHGENVLRPGSLVGEPKGLGAACIFWLALLLSQIAFGRLTWLSYLSCVTFLATLWLTASTSAWISCLVCTGILLLSITNYRFNKSSHCNSYRQLGILAIGLAIPVFVLGIANIEYISEAFENRVVNRMEVAVGDEPEVAALEVLEERPHLAIFGTGLGGISFYIAEHLQCREIFILAPNNGVLNYVCEIGVVGLGILILFLWPGIRPSISGNSSSSTITLSLIGTMLFTQCLIHGNYLVHSLAYGFLFAASIQGRHGPATNSLGTSWSNV